jgi:hypothetical protein
VTVFILQAVKVTLFSVQMMLLKLNKEGPFKRDVFRAPGHQGNMRKLIHFLQQVTSTNLHTELLPNDGANQ